MHVNMIEDENGDLADIRYYCSQGCAIEGNAPQPSAWPGGMEADYCTYCETCGAVVGHGIEGCSHVTDCPV